MNDGPPNTGAEAPPRSPSPLGFLLVGLLALGLCLALGWQITAARRAGEATRARVTASFERQVAVSRTILLLLQAESAHRGYVITADPRFLAPYAPARRELGGRFAALDRLYAAQPAQAGRLARLRATVTAKFAEMDAVLRLRDGAGLAAAAARIADHRGRVLMERSRAAADALVAGERDTLARSLAAVAHGRRVIDTWILVALAALFGCVAIGLAVNWRIHRARFRSQHESWDALARLRAVFASTSDAMLTLNPSGSIETANAATERMFGYPPGALVRRDVATLIDLAPGGSGSFADRIGLRDGRFAAPFRSGRTARHRDGHAVPVDVALGAMPLAGGDHVVVALRDVSERHEAERLKDEFVATVSHELRTPLTSVIGALGLLRSGAAGELPGQAQRLADIAENNARRLIRLINDILDIDRIGSGRLSLSRAVIDLDEVAQRGCADAEGLSQQRGVHLHHEPAGVPLPVSGDAERLLQVVGNLLSNAIRFSPAGGTVRIATAHDGTRALLTVSDEGPGVPPEFRDRLFERFSQSAAGAAIPGGTGLGLAISREIAKAHDGALWYDEAPGGGARFSLALDLLPDRPDIPADAPRRILLCEDDADAAAVLATMIAVEGVAVELCGSAREAQAKALSGHYDCVVLDLRLPDASGLTAVRALRAHAETRRLPLIVVSAEAETEGRSPSAHALDVIDWIDKPVDRERLLDALVTALDRAADGRPTLLHVDDDPDMLEVTAIGLAERGRMLSATSLAEARAILAEVTPDIVILDINLPDGSGFELMPALLRADGHAVPTIIYSATDVDADAARPFEAALVKSRRSVEALSDAIRAVLVRAQERG